MLFVVGVPLLKLICPRYLLQGELRSAGKPCSVGIR